MSESSNIGGDRPRTVRVTYVSPDGQRRTVDMSEQEYRELVRQQRFSSPLESLFGGRSSLFDEFFGDDVRDDRREDRGERVGQAIPIRSGRGRGAAAGVEERLSEHAVELLQEAARTAQN